MEFQLQGVGEASDVLKGAFLPLLFREYFISLCVCACVFVILLS